MRLMISNASRILLIVFAADKTFPSHPIDPMISSAKKENICFFIKSLIPLKIISIITLLLS